MEYYQPVMLNQKGIILMPIVVWTVVILGSILIAQDAVKKGYIQINFPSSDQVTNVAGTPSPEPTLIPITTEEPTMVPTTNTQQRVNTPQVTGDGSRTGRIVKYKEYCKGGQEISVYENELITKKASDGNSYSMTKADWDCYSNNVATQPSNTQLNYPPCTIYYPALGYSRTYNYTSPSDCSYWQERAKVTTQPLNLPEIKAAPLPTVEPYKPSQEYLDANAKAMKNISDPWKPTQVVLPTPRCYSTWEEYFKAHDMGNAPIYGTINSGPIPCD